MAGRTLLRAGDGAVYAMGIVKGGWISRETDVIDRYTPTLVGLIPSSVTVVDAAAGDAFLAFSGLSLLFDQSDDPLGTHRRLVALHFGL